MQSHLPSPVKMPREHGAWAMLLQPFLGTLIALKAASWTALIALTCVVFVFLIREPLAVLARQKWVWRGQNLETPVARKQLLGLLVGLLSSGALLLREWPWQSVLGLGGAAGALTVLAVHMSVRNRLHNVWFQALSAAGLSASGIVACLAVNNSVPAFGWWWWALHTVHFLTGILVVHIRLQARIDAKHSVGVTSLALRGMRNQARIVQSLVALGGLALVGSQYLYYGLALLLSSAVHFRDIASADSPEAVAMPMKTVGMRALALSLVFTILLIAQV